MHTVCNILFFFGIVYFVYYLSITTIEPYESIYREFPQIIFQTWKTKIQSDIPYYMKKWSASWKKNNPNFKYLLWDDIDNRNFIKQYYPWFLAKYDSYDVNIKRVDAIRYFFLYHYGGIYADMDFECLKDFNPLLKMYDMKADVLLGKMSKNEHAHNIPNAIMISKPKETFWIYVFHMLLVKPSKGERVENTTGPILLKDALKLYNDDKNVKNKVLSKMLPMMGISSYSFNNTYTRVKILDPEYFYPIDWTNAEHQKLYTLKQYRTSNISNEKNNMNSAKFNSTKEFPNSYAVTYWTHTW